MLLRLIVGGQTSLKDDNCESSVQSKGLSIAQDLVYCTSGGRKWTPKHIGLASTLHQATRSKDLVQLFNKAGHCLSYDQVLQVDTSLAENTLKSLDPATGAIIPPNLVANKFIHYTCDNIDILDDTLDEKNTFHATQMAAWQQGRTIDVSPTNLEPSKKHTLIVPNALEELHSVKIKPGTSKPIFTVPVSEACFNLFNTTAGHSGPVLYTTLLQRANAYHMIAVSHDLNIQSEKSFHICRSWQCLSTNQRRRCSVISMPFATYHTEPAASYDHRTCHDC